MEKLTPEQWATVSEDAHLRVFLTKKPAEWDRIDYALLAIKEGADPVGYMSCREVTHDTVYWQYGGSFENIRGTTTSWRAYQAFLEWARGKYKFVSTYVKNDNMGYLKMALKAGFRIIGTKTYKEGIYLDLLLEVGNDD